jgi:hypothetical protein
MTRHFALLAGMIALTGALLAGCNNETTGPDNDGQAPTGVTNETTAMQYFAREDYFSKNDEETFSDRAIEPTDFSTFGKVDAAIIPLRWGRFVTTVTRTVNVTVLPGDSIAVAAVEKDIIGELRIRALNGTGDTVVITKPFNDRATRNVVFKRVRRESARYWLNWVPVATSLVDGGTVGQSGTIDLTRLAMYLPNGDSVVVTDPNRFWLRYRWTYLFTRGDTEVPELAPGARARLQAQLVSASPDTDIVALRFGVGGMHRARFRMRLVSQEFDATTGKYTRVYEIPFVVHPHRGFFHAGVDAVTKATLFDDQAPYAVSWWGIPYRVL